MDNHSMRGFLRVAQFFFGYGSELPQIWIISLYVHVGMRQICYGKAPFFMAESSLHEPWAMDGPTGWPPPDLPGVGRNSWSPGALEGWMQLDGCKCDDQYGHRFLDILTHDINCIIYIYYMYNIYIYIYNIKYIYIYIRVTHHIMIRIYWDTH